MKNLASIARKGERKTKAVPPKNVTKKITTEEERDIRAKQKVEELLKDSDLTIKKDDNVEEKKVDVKKGGLEWLEEQVDLQVQEIEKLNSELDVMKNDYEKLHDKYQALKSGENIIDDDTIKNNIITLFNELQDNYIKMGVSPSGVANFRIVPVAFMNRLIMFFPFLSKLKKF